MLVERGEMLSHHLVQGLLAGLQNWPEPVLRSHKDAKHPLHKLTFIADLGLQAGDPDVDEVIKRVLAHRSSEGPFMVLVNYPKHFGGSGEDQDGLGALRCAAGAVCAGHVRVWGRLARSGGGFTTSWAWCGKTAGRVPAQQTWESSGGPGGWMIPARMPTW